MRKLTVVMISLCLALSVLAQTPGHASSQKVTYVAALGVSRNVSRSEVGSYGIGGYTFAGHTTRLKTIKVVDSTGNPDIEVMLCVNACTGNNSYQRGFCTNSSGIINLPINLPIGDVIARVSVASTGVWAGEDECAGVATTGDMTLTFV